MREWLCSLISNLQLVIHKKDHFEWFDRQDGQMINYTTKRTVI